MKFFYLIILFFNLSVHANEINSLKDIPRVFVGKSGNILYSFESKIEFKSITDIKLDSNSFGDVINQKVEGIIFIKNDRILNISRVVLQKYNLSPDYYSLKVFTTDPFVKFLNFELRKNDDSFTLVKQNTSQEQLQMILTGTVI